VIRSNETKYFRLFCSNFQTCDLIQHELSSSQFTLCSAHTRLSTFMLAPSSVSSYVCHMPALFFVLDTFICPGSVLLHVMFRHWLYAHCIIVLIIIYCCRWTALLLLGCSCSLLLSRLLYLYTVNSAILSVSFCYVYASGRACSSILFNSFSIFQRWGRTGLVPWTARSCRTLSYFLWITDGTFHTYLPKNGIFSKIFSHLHYVFYGVIVMPCFENQCGVVAGYVVILRISS